MGSKDLFLMNKNLILILFILPIRIFAQNLVPNPDFENKNGCPTSVGQYSLAEEWFIPNSGTPDYFNDCSNTTDFGTEFNCKGGQIPHSGHGYIGFISENLHGNPFYEYLEIKLKEPLVAGQQYCTRMFVSRGTSTCSLRELGVLFSQTQLRGLTNNLLHLPYVAVGNGTVLSDMQGWMCIKAIYKANGGETFMMIGNFGGDKNFIQAQNDPNSDSSFKTAYYFIDDVSVELISPAGCLCNDEK